MNPAQPDRPQADAPRGPDIGRPVAISLIALTLGVVVEVLFFARPLGISFPLWTLACLIAALVAARIEGVTPSPSSWVVGAVALLCSLSLATRLEPITSVVGLGLTVLLLALFVRLFRFGGLARLGWIDVAVGVGWVPLEAWLRPWSVAGEAWRSRVHERGGRRLLLSVVRGLLLAFPFVVIFTALLSAADVIFGDYVRAALAWIDLERLLDWSARAAVVAISAVFLLGALVAALRPPGSRKLIGESEPLVNPFLGFTEASVVLGLVLALFVAFVIIQFTYLFGGEANIHAAGYTYSEYARRGFGELVAVAFLSLGMIYGLAATVRLEVPRTRAAFLILCAAIVAMVGVMLASAFQRLVLYETAYGFSRLRTYTHLAIVWLAVAFLAFLVLLATRRLRRLAPAGLLMVVGFGLSLAALDVDAFIVDRNSARFRASGDLDLAYLSSLSHDAVPGLVRLAAELDGDPAEALLADLACRRRALRAQEARLDWPSMNLARSRALAALGTLGPDLEAHPVFLQSGGGTDRRGPVYLVRVADGFGACRSSWT